MFRIGPAAKPRRSRRPLVTDHQRACGSSSTDDVATSQSDSGSAATGNAGNTGGNATGSTGGADTNGTGGAEHTTTGGTGGSAGNAPIDASAGGRSGGPSTADAMTIDVQPDGPWKVAPLPAVGTPGVVYLSRSSADESGAVRQDRWPFQEWTHAQRRELQRKAARHQRRLLRQGPRRAHLHRSRIRSAARTSSSSPTPGSTTSKIRRP